MTHPTRAHAAPPSEFSPFTSTHLAVLVAFALVLAAMVVLVRAWRDRAGVPASRRRLGAAALAVWAIGQVYWLLPARWDPATSLPLHVCDLGGAVAACAMLRRWRGWRALLYFWGFVLSAQAFITPVLTEGPATIRFWLFWLTHGVIVAWATLDVAVFRFRPRARDLTTALVLSYVYIVAVFALNLITGWNYGYVGRPRTPHPTILDALGPWPWRVLALILLGSLGFALAWAPWAIASRLAQRRAGVGASG